jgi:hypothetical protein
MSSVVPLRTIHLDARDVAPVTRRQDSRADYFIAAIVVFFSTLIFVLWNRAVLHWFIIPAMVCGVLVGVDVVRWLRGRLDFFDPRTIIGCLGVYLFFVSPLLHVAWDRFGAGYDLILFGDWRPWLAAMATLNAVALLAYRIAHNWAVGKTKPSVTRWEINYRRFYPVFALALACSIGAVATFLWQLGGINGLIDAYEYNPEAFVGKGWLLVLAWPLAVLSFIVIAVVWTDPREKSRHHLATGIILLSLAGIGHFLLLGWFGSRGTTVWAIFWMAGIVHYRFRKLSAVITVAGLILLVGFMYFYGFYKEQKRASLDILRSPAMWLQPKGYERDMKYLLLGDLARSDSDAYILHNLVKDPGDYNYRWGLTYAGALAILIPKNFWPDRPDFKIEAGTEAQLGKATPWRSLRTYGLGGEAMLNFGPWGVVPMFVFYGAALGWYRRKLKSWTPSDSRMLLAPFFSILFANVLVGDSDNLVYAVMTQGLLIAVALFASSNRVHLEIGTNHIEGISHS